MRRLLLLAMALGVLLAAGAGVAFLGRRPETPQFAGMRQFRPAARVTGGDRLTPADVLAADSTESDAVVETRDYPSPQASIVINEIHYHPSSDDRRDEWIELLNRGKAAVDLSGWKLTEAVTFTFPAGTALAPGKHLIVGADRARMARALRLEEVVGDWRGTLSDAGENVRLADANGAEVDAVAYSDRSPFPVLADGLGRSLERRSPHASSSSAANWGASCGRRGGWVRFAAEGTATSNRLYFYLLAPGTAYVDDVTIERLGDEGEPSLKEDFEDAASGWTSNGNHSRSIVAGDVARSGKRSLKLVSSGAGSGRMAAAARDFSGVRLGESYRLEFWTFFPEPRVPLAARFSSGGGGVPGLVVQTNGGGAGGSTTPGRTNSIYAASLPPFLFPVAHDPPRPAPEDAVTVRAVVSAGAPIREVFLLYDDGHGERSTPLFDDGAPEHGDAAGGDGTYSARLGSFRAGTLVRYRAGAEDVSGTRGEFPFAGSPTTVLGFYVEPAAARIDASDFPVYRLFVSGAALQDLNSNPFSDAYHPGTFVFEGRVHCDAGARYRGQTSRGIPKHHWKVKFQKDSPFIPEPGHDPVGSINLNSSFGDKSFLREMLGYNLWRDLGEAYCETRHVLVELNGSYLGFYVGVENPNDDFLERNDLEKSWLWKAYSGANQGAYGFELKAGDEETGSALLAEFLEMINSLSGAALDAYIREHMNVDSFADYLAACQLIHSADHVEKNYLVHADKGGRFTFLPWDLDLTHGRNFECAGGGIWNDTIRHDLWDPDYRDSELLFGTRAHLKCDGYWNAVIDAFLRRTRAFRPLYYQRLAEHLAHYYHPEVLIPKVERLCARIKSEVERDRQRWGTYGQSGGFDRDREALVRWVERRFAHLKGKLEALGYKVGEPLNADFESDVRAGPAPLRVVFRNLSAGRIDACEWDFGDGEKSDARVPEHFYAQPGRYDVTLKVSGPGGMHAATRKGFVSVEP